MTSTTKVRSRIAAAAGVSLMALTGVQALQDASASAAVNLKGTVVCSSGQRVVGVWVDSPAGGSGWATWAPQPGVPNVAQYSRSINGGGNISLHVGCGTNSNGSWRGDNWTPGAPATGGVINAVCADTTGTGVRCALPKRGTTRTTNWFDAGYCTWGAAQKMKDAIGAFPGFGGNAYQWADKAAAAGWTVRNEAAPRSIFVFQPYSGTTSSLGHVGWVDSVEYRADGVYIRTTEMNARGLGVWSSEFRKVPAAARFIWVG